MLDGYTWRHLTVRKKCAQAHLKMLTKYGDKSYIFDIEK